MVYNSILLDVFNLSYRKQGIPQNATPIDIANHMISFIEGDVKSHLADNGNIYLLYDPIPELFSTDLKVSKNFRFTTERQEICPSYKASRVGKPEVIEAVKLVKKYYTFRGENIKTCISKFLEADDFVEDIVNKETGKIALVSNDKDWARYISDSVDMINKDFGKPYSVSEYFKEYGMMPTIASVTFRKAIYGDSSDEVKPISSIKKIKFYCDFDQVVHNFLVDISTKKIELQELMKYIRNTNSTEIVTMKEARTPFQEFLYTLYTADLPIHYEISPVDLLINNVRVIESRCKDADKYISCKKIDEKVNTLLDVTLGRVGTKKKVSFGKIKI